MAGAAVANMGSLVQRYYRTENAVERGILRAIMIRGIDVAGEAREDQAIRTISALDRALDKGDVSAD